MQYIQLGFQLCGSIEGLNFIWDGVFIDLERVTERENRELCQQQEGKGKLRAAAGSSSLLLSSPFPML